MMAANFLADLDLQTWQTALACYQLVLDKKAEAKTKKSAREDLLRLDNWYQNELPKTVEGRTSKHITSEELVKLVKWKLSRGKFRPRLEQLAQSNAPEEVEKLSTQAFKFVDGGKSLSSVKKAIDLLCKLKGIGPATASAVLSAACPDQAAFMSDEPTQLALQTPSLKYSISEYTAYVEVVRDVSHKLNLADEEFGWTPRKVETAMWSHQVGTALGVEFVPPKHSTDAKSTSKRAASPKHSTDAKPTSKRATSPKHSTDAKPTSKRATSPKHSTDAKPTSKRATSPKHSTDAKPTSKRATSPKRSTDAKPTSKRATSPKHSTDAKPTSKRATSPKHSTDAKPTSKRATSPKHSTDAKPTSKRAASPKHSTDAKPTSKRAASPKHSTDAKFTSKRATSPKHSTDAKPTSKRATSPKHSTDAKPTSKRAASPKHSTDAKPTSKRAASQPAHTAGKKRKH